MFTNQKVLGLVLILFIIGTISFLAVSKFKQEVGQATASPSPSPSLSPQLSFNFGQTPAPTQVPGQTQGQKQQTQSTPQPQPSELPLEKNKRLSQFPGVLQPEILQNKKAILKTSKGIIEFEIYPDAPMAASNFMILAANGFYNGLKFHRVEPGFVIQGGDPLGDGTGGPGYMFPDEEVTKDYLKGIVAMANSGPNTNGSQFFIMLEDRPELPKQYTIFGKVILGIEVIGKIAVGDVIQQAVIQDLH